MSHTVMKLLRAIGGHRATLAVIGLTAAIVSAGLAGLISIATWVWLPGIGLLLNLAAALLAYPALRGQPWLFAFHALTGVLVLVAMADALTAFKGRVEITEGASFAPSLVQYEAGPLHPLALDRIEFVQGGFKIRYAPGMKRRETESTVLMPVADGRFQPRVVGDEHPLILAGYRFYTTHNKGFAPVLTYTDAEGRSVTGSVHMPSYPLFSHRQANEWTPPGGDRAVGLWLTFPEPVYDEHNDWSFSRPEDPTLVVTDGDLRHELRPGQGVPLGAGELKFEGVRVWMGYKITSNSLAAWLMALSIVAAVCLGIHIVTRRPAKRVLPRAEVQHG